jgi:hypothetical protein
MDQYLESSIRDFQEGNPYILVWMFLLGLAIGSLVLLLLSYFPGKSYGHHHYQLRILTTNVILITGTPDLKSETIQDEKVDTGSKPTDEKKQQKPSAKQDSSWPGDEIPPEQLETIRKKFHLTPQQMGKVLERSREEARTGSAHQEESWTPHQKLNACVYVIMISVMIYFFNRDYGNIVTHSFIRFFPKEAAILGLPRMVQ